MKRYLVPLIMTEVQLMKRDMSLLGWQEEHLVTHRVGRGVEKQALTWVEGV